jgi:hypothetical protein
MASYYLFGIFKLLLDYIKKSRKSVGIGGRELFTVHYLDNKYFWCNYRLGSFRKMNVFLILSDVTIDFIAICDPHIP